MHDSDSPGLTHLTPAGRPRMVDVGGKAPSVRRALAEALVRFPPEVAARLRESGLRTGKGPILDTAIVAGTLAVKRTHELIPFCHPLPIEHCAIDGEFISDTDFRLTCEVGVTHRTGVEMEALTGVSVAALTVYDMCKALSHAIAIAEVCLVEKHGGKREVVKATGAP